MRAPVTASCALLAACVLASCGGSTATDELPVDVGSSLFALTSAVDGVYLFPPLAPQPVYSGANDPTLLRDLSVVLEATNGAGAVRTVATFTSATQPSLVLLEDHGIYFVNVPAATYFTDSSSAYRFRILLGARELARSDMSDRVFTALAANPGLLVGVKVHIEDRPAPVITALAPSSAPPGGASFTLTVDGSGFANDSVVYANGVALATTFVSGGRLTAVVPGSLLGAPGSVAITVVTPGPGGGTSAPASLGIEDHTACPPPTGTCWTQLSTANLGRIAFGATNRYLYCYLGNWYISPTTSLPWSWTVGRQLTGTYLFFDGSRRGAFDCNGSGEQPPWGTSCSNGPGGTFKTLTIYGNDPSVGTGTVCQDQPNAFHTGPCANASLYWTGDPTCTW